MLAVHNRIESTIAALTGLRHATLPQGIKMTIVVLDAGSNDGTIQAIQEQFPEVQLLRRGSDLYWASSMREAWLEVTNLKPDYILWLNDDVLLKKSALLALFDTMEANGRCIVGGAFVDPKTQVVTYGGYIRGPWWHRLDLRPLPKAESVQECDALNGNILLVSAEVDKDIGGFPAGYTHGLADFAYTLGASRRGIRVLVAPDVVGYCSRNSADGTWVDQSLGRAQRMRLILAPKGLPLRQWAKYCFSFGGLTGAITFISPYLKVLTR